MTPNLHLWLIPILPLVGAALNGFFGRRFSRQTVSAIALTFCGASFVMALWVAIQFSSLTLPHYELLAHWIRYGDFMTRFTYGFSFFRYWHWSVAAGEGLVGGPT